MPVVMPQKPFLNPEFTNADEEGDITIIKDASLAKLPQVINVLAATNMHLAARARRARCPSMTGLERYVIHGQMGNSKAVV